MNRALAEQRGRSAERIAGWYLRMKGWRIVDTRVRTPVRKIDIVARRFRTTAFVEVKSSEKSADLDYAVDRHRLRRVAAAASARSARHGLPGGDVRIDVILIAPGRISKRPSNVWED
jgi:putative endonuclease